MKPIVLALACTGCAQLFGIDTTTGSNVDAPGPGVHTTIQVVSIGATVVTDPLDQTQTSDTVTFLDPDGAGGYHKLSGTVIAPGSWQANIATGNPVVDFTVFGGRHVWAFPTRDLHVAAPVLQHPNPEAPPTGAQLVMNVTIPTYTVGESYQLEAIGAWAYHNLVDVTELPATGGTLISSTLPYTGFLPYNTAAIKRITPDDQVVLLRHVGPDLTGVFQTSFDQTATNTLTGTLAAVTHDKALDANVNPSTLATRYTAVRPAVSGLVMNWSLNAAPGLAKGQNAGPALYSGGVAMADAKIAKPYGNPFASLGWNELLTYATYESRLVTLMPGGQTITLYSALNTFTAPSAGQTLDLPAGLPQTISVEQTPLTSDNMTITLDPTKYAHVSIVADHATNTMYQAALYEVIQGATTATLKYVVETTTNDPQNIILPPDALVAGHLYTIQAFCLQGGFVNAATGDLATTMPPFDQGYTFSGVFTVMN